MKRVHIIIAVLLCTLLVKLHARPSVGAFYYPWFRENLFHWEGTNVQPQLGNYDSNDDAVINQHVIWAASCGINFLVISYWGGADDDAINKVINASAAYGIKIVIMIEPGGAPSDTFGAAQWYIQRFDAIASNGWFQAGNYLKDNSGKNIVAFFQWAPDQPGVLRQVFAQRPDIRDNYWTWYFGPQNTNLAEVRKVFRSNQGTGPQAYGSMICYQPITGGGWPATKDMYYIWSHDQNIGGGVRTPIVSPAMPQPILTVSPCFQNPNINIPRDGGSRLSQQLLDIQNFGHYTGRGNTQANDVQPTHVIVTSWNEWQENSTIEPNVAEGTAYLDVIGQWIY
jgi:hypothetical protein